MLPPVLFSTPPVILSCGLLIQCEVSAELLYDHIFRNSVLHLVKYERPDTFLAPFFSAFLAPFFSAFLAPLIDQDIIS